MTTMTKTQLMAMIARSNGRIHESFEHEHDGLFDITAMRAWAVQTKLKPMSVRISDVLETVLTTRIIDEQRVRELDEASWRNDPAMVVVYDNPTAHLLVDGSHRIVRRYLEGETLFYAYFVPERNIIRPDSREWMQGTKLGIDWGADVSTLK